MIIVLKPEIDPHQIKAIEADVESKGGSPILIEGKERCVVAVGAARWHRCWPNRLWLVMHRRIL